MRKPATLDLVELRWFGLAALLGGLVLPLLGHPGYPCPLRTLTGIPCPLCGMSTSVEDTVHFDLRDAVASNPGGVAVVAGAIVLLVFRPTRKVALPLWVIVLTLCALWIFELFRFSVI